MCLKPSAGGVSPACSSLVVGHLRGSICLPTPLHRAFQTSSDGSTSWSPSCGARTSDHEEALRREAAIAEILQVTNASGGDLALVLNAIIEKATRLCSASYGYIWTYDGESARAVAVHGDARFEEWLLQRDPVRPSQHSPLGRVLLSRRLAHVVDAKEDETYRNDPRFRDLVDRAGLRTLLHVPLRKGDTLLGVITVYRRERQAFTDQQIRLLESFAEQAVIAMENARLLDEQREALEQQTATAEVLEVINSSPGDLAPVFDAMLEKAMRLCAAAFGYLMTYDGKRFAVVANKGLPPRFADYLRNMDQPRSAGLYASILAGAAYAQESDLSKGEVYRISPLRRALVDLGGAQTGIVVSLRKDKALLGVITIYRQEVRPFASKEITLLESFAAQAVIAIENARLINEQREALEQQTATAEILTVISQSPTDVGPVLSAVAKAAMKFCGASDAQVSLREGDEWFVAAHEGPIGAMLGRRTLTRHTAPSRAMIDGKVVQIVDLQTVDADEFPEARELGAKLGFQVGACSAAAARRRLHRRDFPPARRSRRVRPAPGRAAEDICGTSGHRHRERPPVHRAEGIARTADRDRRGAARDLAVADRRATRSESRRRRRAPLLWCRRCGHYPARGFGDGDGRSCRRTDHKRTEGHTHAGRPKYHQRPVDHGRRHRPDARRPCA